MSILYLDSRLGVAGDLMSAALMTLISDPEDALRELNHMGLPGVRFTWEWCEKYEIMGRHMKVEVHGMEEDNVHEHNHEHSHEHRHEHNHQHGHEHHHHEHHSMAEVQGIIRGMTVPDSIREEVLEIYDIIAEAESKAHNAPVAEVHFHEVGMMDAIADVAAACLLIQRISPEEIVASTVHTGNGTVRCAHGIMLVPAPATANILEAIPHVHGDREGELCTPTGAALIRHFADRFQDIEEIANGRTGIGFGGRTFAKPSYFRAVLMDSV